MQSMVARSRTITTTAHLSPLSSSPLQAAAALSTWSRLLEIFGMKGETQEPPSHESQAAGVDLDRFRTRSYTRDINEIKDTGGKLLPLMTRLEHPRNAISFPAIQGTTSNNKSISLPDASKGKVAILAIGFRQHSQSSTDQWTVPLANRFAWKVYSDVIRNMLRKAAQDNIAPEARALFQPFIAFLSSEDGELVRASIGSANRLGSYIVLLDPQGRIRWKASGQPNSIDMELCVSSVLDLVEEAQQQGTVSRPRSETRTS